jgi:hypothetical protein
VSNVPIVCDHGVNLNITITGSPFGTFSKIFFLHYIHSMLYFGFFWDCCETSLQVITCGYFKKIGECNLTDKKRTTFWHNCGMVSQ